MSISALDDFKFEKDWNRWVATAHGEDFDLAVPDDNGRPLQSAISLLDRALLNRDLIHRRAHEYINAFCAASDPELKRMPEIVELSVARYGSTLRVYISLHYGHDRYGGTWSVGFNQIEPNDCFAVSFMRE